MIAGDLAPLPAGVPLNLKDKEDLFPSGHFVVSDGKYEPERAGDFLINLADLRNTKQHPDSYRRNGCCGPDGLDGFNLMCSNGHEIGTERSDCWLPHHVILACDRVRRAENSRRGHLATRLTRGQHHNG